MPKVQVVLRTLIENNEWARRKSLSALFARTQRGAITCGTHFEDTKLVTSITGRPVSESMFISWILTPVGTISCEDNDTELALRIQLTEGSEVPLHASAQFSCFAFAIGIIYCIQLLHLYLKKENFSKSQRAVTQKP